MHNSSQAGRHTQPIESHYIYSYIKCFKRKRSIYQLVWWTKIIITLSRFIKSLSCECGIKRHEKYVLPFTIVQCTCVSVSMTKMWKCQFTPESNLRKLKYVNTGEKNRFKIVGLRRRLCEKVRFVFLFHFFLLRFLLWHNIYRSTLSHNIKRDIKNNYI